MWQALHDVLSSRSFVVIAVAMDQPDAARPWIEAAKPSYPCLIDPDHHVADLYGMVNVPQAVWIDEAGRIVRPTETAGATDGFRAMDREKFTMPAEVAEERVRVKARYVEAVKDWVERDTESVAVRPRGSESSTPGAAAEDVARAHAAFRLGMHLHRSGRTEEAFTWFEEARRLHPDSWNIWRQTAWKDERGLASGPEFWARVDALGDRPYYARSPDFSDTP